LAKVFYDKPCKKIQFDELLVSTVKSLLHGRRSINLISSHVPIMSKGDFTTTAPLASTIVAVALIPVAFLFCDAFLSARRKKRYHPFAGVIAISWDLAVSIGYMMYRTMGGAAEGTVLQVSPAINTYFMVHVPVAVLVMSLELGVLGVGLWQLKTKASNNWTRRLMKILFFVWWFAFLSGEIFYIVMYKLW